MVAVMHLTIKHVEVVWVMWVVGMMMESCILLHQCLVQQMLQVLYPILGV